MIQYIVAAGVGALLGGMGRKNKMAHGGIHRQGYDDKLDESLGMRKGAGRTKKQSRKDRRDESAGMEKSMGRRKYAAVDTMDVGNRMMEKGGKSSRHSNLVILVGNVTPQRMILSEISGTTSEDWDENHK